MLAVIPFGLMKFGQAFSFSLSIYINICTFVAVHTLILFVALPCRVVLAYIVIRNR